MNSECRKYLQNHIKVKLEREPDLTLEDMKLWLLDDKIFDLSQIKTTTFHMFVKRSMDKFRRQMDRDKDMCKRLITSIPNRLKAVINVGGRQVTKADYRQIEAEE